ncbi:MAG: threonine synthase [Kiritimatiellia bacterium]
MRYVSTRGGMKEASFSEAVMTGLAPDGGLIVPGRVPDVSGKLETWSSLSYRDLALEILKEFTDLREPALKALIDKSYSVFAAPEVTPVRKVGCMHVLELFHGPTLSFKDIALQFLGNLFELVLTSSGGRINILGATSGDTGSAAIYGVRGKRNLSIFMMHPKGRISETQERQMTTVLDDNVMNIALEGTFDDCQKVAKTLFRDLGFKRRFALSAVNSINWVRIVCQVVYYFYAAFRVMERSGRERVRFSVPTGNFGDIFAGFMAGRMGLPIERLVLATNENDILARFFNTGRYERGSVKSTISPAMDIQVASNFERYLYYREGEDAGRVRDMMTEFEQSGVLETADGAVENFITAGTAGTGEALDVIRDIYRSENYVVDPHTAVGIAVGRTQASADIPLICLATAHPAKFAESVSKATNGYTPRHPSLDRLADLPGRCAVLPASVSAVREFIKGNAGGDA